MVRKVIINGLEAEIIGPETSSKLAVICHPHPLYQGTMNNKVVTTLWKSMSEIGYQAVRFNFRGVGASDGCYDHGKGELEDLRTIINNFSYSELFLLGFSFGSYIVSEYVRDHASSKILLVAPPVTRFKLNTSFKKVGQTVLVVARNDELFSLSESFDYIKNIDSEFSVETIDSSHFFHGKLLELKNIILKHFDPSSLNSKK